MNEDLLVTTRVQITLEIQHRASVDSRDLGRRISEVTHAATNGLAYDEETLLHDVRMFGVSVVHHEASRL